MTTNPPQAAWQALHIPAHLPALLRDAFAAQQAAFAKNRYPSLQERRADLRALHRLLVDNRAALLDAVNADFGCRSHFETLATELLQGQEAALDAMRQLPRWMKKQKRHLDITQYPLASAYVLPQPVGVIGIVAGVWVCVATSLLEKMKIDDPVGAVPVHLFNGAWGVLAVGIFANGNPDTAAWNGVSTAVTGLLYGGGGQFLAQLFEALAVFITTFAASWVFFKVLAAANLLRVSAKDELAGLDMPEIGNEGYAKDWEPSPADMQPLLKKGAQARPAQATIK